MARTSIAVKSVVMASVALWAGCATEVRAPADRRAAPPAERPPVAVTVEAPATRDVVETIDVVGSVAPKFFADIKSEVTGVVTVVYVTEWSAVRAGQPLARLDASETEAAIGALKAALAQAAVAERRAVREHERARQLLDYGLITPQAADDVQSALEAARTAVAAAQAQIRTAEARLAKFLIRAPMSGVVALRHVNVGDRVENMGGGDPMFRIVDTRVLEVTVSVPSTRLATVRVGQPLEFAADSLPGRQFTARVMFINPAVDEASRAGRVVADLRNRDGALKGGAFVRGRIVTTSRAAAVVVPREALLDWNVGAGTASVYLVDGDCAAKRSVRVGAVMRDGVEIVAGVKPGEPVVTRGGFALRPGDRITAAPAENRGG